MKRRADLSCGVLGKSPRGSSESRQGFYLLWQPEMSFRKLLVIVVIQVKSQEAELGVGVLRPKGRKGDERSWKFTTSKLFLLS